MGHLDWINQRQHSHSVDGTDPNQNLRLRWKMPNIVTAKELGEFLKLSGSTIYKLAQNGVIPGFKIGDSWRFDMDEILRLIQAAKEEAKDKQKV